jgi:hypothetical protein
MPQTNERLPVENPECCNDQDRAERCFRNVAQRAREEKQNGSDRSRGNESCYL